MDCERCGRHTEDDRQTGYRGPDLCPECVRQLEDEEDEVDFFRDVDPGDEDDNE